LLVYDILMVFVKDFLIVLVEDIFMILFGIFYCMFSLLFFICSLLFTRCIYFSMFYHRFAAEFEAVNNAALKRRQSMIEATSGVEIYILEPQSEWDEPLPHHTSLYVRFGSISKCHQGSVSLRLSISFP
jgi:hypothetical protein